MRTRGVARRAAALAAAITSALAAGCLADPGPPFADKGRGVWIEMPGAPAMRYHALWGAGAGDVIAVGDAGIAHWDGEAFRPVGGVPAAIYRAVWGRSPSEVWIGGDGVLLARSLTGWQAQALFDGERPITEYSVLALGGSDAREYAIVQTGGKLLLLENRGSAWETPLWRGGGPAPFPRPPSLYVSGLGNQLLVAGGGEIDSFSTSSDLGVPAWERAAWPYGVELPPVSLISGGPEFWIAAGGGPDVVTYRSVGDREPVVIAGAARRREVRGAFASRANRFFLVGAPAGSAPGSSIEACDEEGCALERVDVGDGAPELFAVWGDPDGAVIAAGDGLIVERTSCGARRCREP
jgi:hypothetical protein